MSIGVQTWERALSSNPAVAREWPCPYCERQFSNAHQRAKHIRAEHRDKFAEPKRRDPKLTYFKLKRAQLDRKQREVNKTLREIATERAEIARIRAELEIAERWYRDFLERQAANRDDDENSTSTHV